MNDCLNFYFIKRAENKEELNNQLKVLAKEFRNFAELVDECASGKQDFESFQAKCEESHYQLLKNLDAFDDVATFGDLLHSLCYCYSDARYLVKELEYVDLDKECGMF